jgi:hypothetical protein
MRIPRVDIIKDIDTAINLLQLSKDNVSKDQLKSAHDEIDEVLSILVEVSSDINARKNSFISK